MGRYKITAQKRDIKGLRMFAKGLALCIGIAAAVNMPLMAGVSDGSSGENGTLSANTGGVYGDNAGPGIDAGAMKLGMNGEGWFLEEAGMKRALDAGWLLICSMGAGDFTSTGHYILICGYDENGFTVNDPNRRSNSERQWDFDTLCPQIKKLWVLRG